MLNYEKIASFINLDPTLECPEVFEFVSDEDNIQEMFTLIRSNDPVNEAIGFLFVLLYVKQHCQRQVFAPVVDLAKLLVKAHRQINSTESWQLHLLEMRATLLLLAASDAKISSEIIPVCADIIMDVTDSNRETVILAETILLHRLKGIQMFV